MEIISAVIGVGLTALCTIFAYRYRSLVTYEITSHVAHLAVQNDAIVEAPAGLFRSTRVITDTVVLVNRGWKNIEDAKFHIESDLDPLCLSKSATNISKESIDIYRKGSSLEISVDFMPRNEEVRLSFNRIGFGGGLFKITGAGTNYQLKTVHYYHGFLEGVSSVKTFIIILLLGYVIADIFWPDQANKAPHAEKRTSGGTSW